MLDQFRDYVFGRSNLNVKRSQTQREQSLARDAVARGQIQPLEAILRNVGSVVHGELLSARLREDSGGVWIYRLVILSDNGRYHRVVVDAGRNAILEITR